MNNNLVFIMGPHCAGKTSLIKALYNNNVANFAGYEIGKQLYYERVNAGFKTENSDASFENEILCSEIERDNYLNLLEGVQLVETWHPGNLAYVLERTPDVFCYLVNKIKQHIKTLKNINLIGVWLQISPETIYKRTKTFSENREWAADFYSKINKNIKTTLNELNLTNCTSIVDAENTFDENYQNVVKIIRGETCI